MILCLGGVDSSGGAGLDVDTMICRVLHHSFIAIETAYTVQTEWGVQSIVAHPPQQLMHALNDALLQPIRAIKIGMLANADIVSVVSECLASVCVPIILDPVLAASNGGLLLDAAAIPILIQTLMQQATLVTPNLPEIATLLQCSLDSSDDIEYAACQAIAQGMQAVLIKGGHALEQESRDYLYEGYAQIGHWFTAPRIDVAMRGTGCRLATCIACYLAQGHSLYESVRLAKNLVYNLLHAAVDW